MSQSAYKRKRYLYVHVHGFFSLFVLIPMNDIFENIFTKEGTDKNMMQKICNIIRRRINHSIHLYDETFFGNSDACNDFMSVRVLLVYVIGLGLL